MSRTIVAACAVLGLVIAGVATGAPRAGVAPATTAKGDSTVRKACTCRICVDTTMEGRCKVWTSEERSCPCPKR